MSVHLRSFLTRTPNADLRRFFCRLSTAGFSTIDWQLSRQQLADALTLTIQGLPNDAQDELYATVDSIAQFMSSQGRSVLRSVVEEGTLLLEEFDAKDDVIACALLVLEREPDTFDRGLAAMYVHRLLNGRNWTGLDFEGAVPDVKPNDSLGEFERRLKEIFSQDGPAARVMVKRFSRHSSAVAHAPEQLFEQYSIYVEAPPETLLTFSGDANVEPQTIRPVLEGALLFDRVEGTLDVVCKRAGKARRLEIAEAFLYAVLEPYAQLAARSRRTLRLDALKTGPLLEIRPSDGVRRAEIIAITLSAPDSGSLLTIEARGVDLFEHVSKAFGSDSPLAREGWSVRFAKLRVIFEPEGSTKRAKSVVFELREPDRTNLRDQIELHRRIADTMLARWGLYANAT